VTTTVSSTTVRTGSSFTSQETISKRVAPKDDPVSKVTTPSTDPVKAKSDLFDRGLTYFEDWTTAHRKEYFQQAGNKPSTNLGILQYFFEQHGFPNVTCSVKGGGCSNMPSQHALLNKRDAHSAAQMDQFKFAGLYINQFMAYHAMIIESLEHARDDVRHSCSEFAHKFFHPTQKKKKTPCLAVIIPMAILALFVIVSVAAFAVTAKALLMTVALFAPAKRSEEVLSIAPFVRGFGIIGASMDENGRGSYVLEIRKNPKAKRHANIAAQDQNNALRAVTEVSKVLQLYGFVLEAPKNMTRRSLNSNMRPVYNSTSQWDVDLHMPDLPVFHIRYGPSISGKTTDSLAEVCK
jgi:hypothetical protein